MANKNLFKTSRTSTVVPVTNTVNNAGGVAYSMTAKHALAQLACTGCFNDTFYVSAKTQLKDILDLAAKCPPELVAKTAVMVMDLINERHEKELQVLRDRIVKLQKALSICASWLESGHEIITENYLGDEDDDERCLEIIAEARALVAEPV